MRSCAKDATLHIGQDHRLLYLCAGWYELRRLKSSGRGGGTLSPVAIYLADVAERARDIIQVLCRLPRQVGAVRDCARPS
jgi:hypothetical protein